MRNINEVFQERVMKDASYKNLGPDVEFDTRYLIDRKIGDVTDQIASEVHALVNEKVEWEAL